MAVTRDAERKHRFMVPAGPVSRIEAVRAIRLAAPTVNLDVPVINRQWVVQLDECGGKMKISNEAGSVSKLRRSAALLVIVGAAFVATACPPYNQGVVGECGYSYNRYTAEQGYYYAKTTYRSVSFCTRTVSVKIRIARDLTYYRGACFPALGSPEPVNTSWKTEGDGEVTLGVFKDVPEGWMACSIHRSEPTWGGWVEAPLSFNR